MKQGILKNIMIVVACSVFVFLGSSNVFAGFGISPTDIISPYLKKGAVVTKEFTLSRSDEVEQELNVEIEPDLGDISSWFSYEPGTTFKFEKGKEKMSFKVIINIPSDAKEGSYTGVIRVKASPVENIVGEVSITKGVRIDVGITVTESDFAELSILSIKSQDNAKGSGVKIDIVGENTGNIEVSPYLNVAIYNLNMEKLEEHKIENFGTFLPNTSATLTAQFSTSLPNGEYFMEISVMLGDKELRKERLVVTIIPEEGSNLEEKKENSFGTELITFLGNWEHILLICVPIIISVCVYIVLTKLWDKEEYKGYAQKWWGLFCGSQTWSRILFSMLIGLVTLSCLMLILSLA